jgi:hypothetical protein
MAAAVLGISFTFVLVAGCTLSDEPNQAAGGTSGATAVAGAGAQMAAAGAGGLTSSGGTQQLTGAGGVAGEVAGGESAGGESAEGGMPTKTDPEQPNGVDCASDAECPNGKYCEGSACATTKAVGALCKAPGECTTAICNDYETNVRPGHCCATPSNCACPGPAFANLLENPGFDKDLSGWDIHDNGVTGGTYRWYQFEERDMCPHSGQFRRNPNSSTSGYSVSIRQCVPVQAGTTYNFGGSWKSSTLPEPAPGGEAWNASCVIAFYATLDLCKDYGNEYQSRFDDWKSVDLHSRTTEVYHWYDFSESMTAPNSARAAVLDCSGLDDYAASTTICFDKMFVSPAPTAY